MQLKCLTSLKGGGRLFLQAKLKVVYYHPYAVRPFLMASKPEENLQGKTNKHLLLQLHPSHEWSTQIHIELQTSDILVYVYYDCTY